MLAVAPPGQRPLKITRPLCSMHALLLATAKTQLLGEHSCTALQWGEIKGQTSTAELVRRPKSATPKLAAFPPAAVDASFTTSCFTASRCGGPRLELADQHRQRRLVLTATTQLAALLLSSSLPAQPACASLPSAAANGLPLLGRFEALKGAAAFIGAWQLGGPESAGPRGVLSLLRSGDVELRTASGAVIGLGTAPWTYVSPKGSETTVALRFVLDVDDPDRDGYSGVFVYQATLDSAGGPGRVMAGVVNTNGRQLGSFSAAPIE